MPYLQIPFTVVSSGADETVVPGLSPADLAVHLATMKAQAVAEAQPAATIIAADTVVSMDRNLLGKPVDARDALRMLRLLSSRWHDVHTGVVVLRSGKATQAAAMTKVHMRSLSVEEIRAYVATGEPIDKAGAYGIQGRGASLIDAIDGCYLAVVGFPLCTVGRLLVAAGVEVPMDPEGTCREAANNLSRAAVLGGRTGP